MNSKLIRASILGLAVASFVACRAQNSVASRVKFTPSDRNAKNVALIVGSPNDLSGVAKDVVEVSKMIKEADFGYEVVVINDATASQIMSKAEEIGKSLSPQSTVFFYFSGHGSESGYLFSEGYQSFRVSSVAKRIGQGMGQGKFKRFIAVMDSCYSGQNIDGEGAMFLEGEQKDTQKILNKSLGYMSYDLEPKTSPDVPFEQALMLAASQSNETSLDFGSSVGGAFTSSWTKMFKKDTLNRKSATIGQLLEETRAETRRQTGNSHTPVWKAMPESLLNESLSSISDTSTSDNEIYLALGDAADGAMVFASIPSSISVASAELCKGDKVSCSTGNSSKVAAFIPATDMKVNGRTVLRSDKTVQLSAGIILTLVIRDSNGLATQTRSVTINQK